MAAVGSRTSAGAATYTCSPPMAASRPRGCPVQTLPLDPEALWIVRETPVSRGGPQSRNDMSMAPGSACSGRGPVIHWPPDRLGLVSLVGGPRVAFMSVSRTVLHFPANPCARDGPRNTLKGSQRRSGRCNPGRVRPPAGVHVPEKKTAGVR